MLPSTILPCQLHEYLSDKDTCLMSMISSMGSISPSVRYGFGAAIITRRSFLRFLSSSSPAETILSAYRDFAGPREIPFWHMYGTVFERDYRPVSILCFSLIARLRIITSPSLYILHAPHITFSTRSSTLVSHSAGMSTCYSAATNSGLQNDLISFHSLA